MLYKILSITLLVLVISSCKENSTSSNDSFADIFPNQTGNSWIHTISLIDTNGIILSEPNEIDSMLVNGLVELDGKTAIECNVFEISNQTKNKGNRYFLKDQNKLYLQSGNRYSLLDLLKVYKVQMEKPVMTESWFKVADFDQSSWELYKYSFDNSDMTIKDVSGKISGTTQGTVSKGKLEDIMVDGIKYKSHEFIVEETLESNLDIESTNGTISIKVINRFWIADSVGIIKSKREVTSVIGDIPFTNTKETTKLEGVLIELARFHIQK